MTIFLDVLPEKNKPQCLQSLVTDVRAGQDVPSSFELEASQLAAIPGKPFAYWATKPHRDAFSIFSPIESDDRCVRVGDHPGDGFRYLRLWWEPSHSRLDWVPYQKGGSYSKFYFDIHLVTNWDSARNSYRGFFGRPGRSSERPSNYTYFFRPGLTWPRRSQRGFGMRAMPAGCVFADKGPAVILSDDDPKHLLAILGIATSSTFSELVSLQMAFGSYEVGVIQRTPIPKLSSDDIESLSIRMARIWEIRWQQDTWNETSHAFVLPYRLREFESEEISQQLVQLREENDVAVAGLYQINTVDRLDHDHEAGVLETDAELTSDLSEDDDFGMGIDEQFGLLSWCVGVSCGHFDLRLATEEREYPPVPGPFDPLPSKSPGMLPDGDEPFHPHAGILVECVGHPHDLPQLIEAVLERVDQQVPDNLRRWLQKDFFKEHLKQYSKSRRKAPIYWPLVSAAGSYTLWVYYPDLDDQTLYTAVNDFLEPKLKLVGDELNSLHAKSNRSAAEERELEKQQDLEKELIELRDTILEIAPTYKPNHDDGVQITAAPLWPLFRHKPWQKVLKDTWGKLETGDYDWAHLAYSYWPDRVREKCQTDKSLAIAHGLEELYRESAA